MSKALDTKHGNVLFQLLPEVYRSRDNARFDESGKVTEHGDLGHYLDAMGVLFDQLDNTLKQRLADCFPDQPDMGLACQPWLLPYFARLLDVRVVSPDDEGQREEIANAVAWRQRKGTVQNAETIAEVIGHLEVELQEAWQRVATTPRMGEPILPATALGEPNEWDLAQMPAIEVAQFPGLPSVTVDVRKHSLAVRTEADNPVADQSVFDGELIHWRRRNPSGVPCAAGTFHDSSKRTVDVRDANWRVGHFHPKRALMYAPHPSGFFYEDAVETTWNAIKAGGSDDVVFTETTREINDKTVAVHHYQGVGSQPVKVTGAINWNTEALLVLENLVVADDLNIKKGALETRNTAVNQLLCTSNWDTSVVWNARGTLVNGVHIKKNKSCLMEFVTVLGQLIVPHPLASDCVFLQPAQATDANNDLPTQGCIRYSRVEEDDANLALLPLYGPGCTARRPLLFSDVYGETACGVLHPQTHKAIRFGAEDQGEMGAYHDLRLCLRFEAVIDKLQDFLPVGIKAVLIPDATLSCAPPQPV